ncbi:hypothetical protein ANO14919_088480 [Xylariales sp. No.14919]|nr:hypothetical protein ANO14919_088480 [Xylariales sp. No.14919]
MDGSMVEYSILLDTKTENRSIPANSTNPTSRGTGQKHSNVSSQIEEHSEYNVREIVSRAEGVFLWAYLVVRLVLSELEISKSRDDLK